MGAQVFTESGTFDSKIHGLKAGDVLQISLVGSGEYLEDLSGEATSFGSYATSAGGVKGNMSVGLKQLGTSKEGFAHGQGCPSSVTPNDSTPKYITITLKSDADIPVTVGRSKGVSGFKMALSGAYIVFW